MGSRALLRPRGRLSILSGAAGPREAEADAAPSESANSHPLDAAPGPRAARTACRRAAARPLTAAGSHLELRAATWAALRAGGQEIGRAHV